MIQTEGLHIGYKDALVEVENLNLESGVHILIGKNGSGKSTFLKTIAGQLSPISGKIQIAGKLLSEIESAQIPKIVAFVSTRFPVVDFLRVSEYIALGRSPHTAYFGKLRSEDLSSVNNAIESIGITHLKDRFTNELSDGERQLVAIARALAQETPVIALDEPTAFLDYSNKKLVLENLSRIAKKFNKCVIISSHDIELSIESECPFLVVESREKKIIYSDNRLAKGELLSMAFDI